MARKTSFFYCFLLLFSLYTLVSSQSSSFPQNVIREMASRKMRYHHYLWHQVREGWNRFPESTKNAFRNINWAPPRAARSYDSSGSASPIYDNNSGEDFLYMHRQMIATARSLASSSQQHFFTGWTTIPSPTDSSYPVPSSYSSSAVSSSSLSTWKSSSFYNSRIRDADANFKNPSQLRRWTLGELGARIETTMHSWLHMRFSSSSSVGYRTSYRGTIPNVDTRWDNQAYNWLGDSYSSHVNPIFWKLHGWVDDRVEDWRRANGLSSIRWKGTWVGGPMSNLGSVGVMKHGANGTMHSMDDPNTAGDTLEEAFKILKESGVPEFSIMDDIGGKPRLLKAKRKVKTGSCHLRKKAHLKK